MLDNLVVASREFVSEQRKCQFMQFVAPFYSVEKLKAIGFHIGSKAHSTAKNWYQEHDNHVASVPLQQGGHKPNPELAQDVTEFCYDNSRVAANRFSVKKNKNFRFLDDTVVHLFNKYKNDESRCKCSDSTFRNTVDELGIFIRPSRDSDLCHYCESYKISRKKLITLENLHKDYYNEVDQDDDIVLEMKEEGIECAEGFDSSEDDELLSQIKHVNVDKLEDFAVNHEGFGEDEKS